MKLIIAGGRDFTIDKISTDGYVWIYELLHKLNVKEIISGGCRGADKIGECLASELILKTKIFNAEWDKYGKAAGVIRNAQMAKYADGVLLFPGGRGTVSMEHEALLNTLNVYYYPKKYLRSK